MLGAPTDPTPGPRIRLLLRPPHLYLTIPQKDRTFTSILGRRKQSQPRSVPCLRPLIHQRSLTHSPSLSPSAPSRGRKQQWLAPGVTARSCAEGSNEMTASQSQLALEDKGQKNEKCRICGLFTLSLPSAVDTNAFGLSSRLPAAITCSRCLCAPRVQAHTSHVCPGQPHTAVS